MRQKFTTFSSGGDYPAEEIAETVKSLCAPESYGAVYHRTEHDAPMPSIESLERILTVIKSVIFPGYFLNSDVKPETIVYHTGASLDLIYSELCEEIRRGYCFTCAFDTASACVDCDDKSKAAARGFISSLPKLRKMLYLDARAAYLGDPAAKGIGEAIFCYPSVGALTHHRIAHELYTLDVPLIPRIISEMAHSKTGIDIHPGAQIGDSFFIDHGTGTVIGETTVIGANVRIYQGVTLGARSFPLDETGNPIKGVARHPIVEDNVIIYSGATILGRITIGAGAEIGGNVWITSSVPPGARVSQSKYEERYFSNGEGI